MGTSNSEIRKIELGIRGFTRLEAIWMSCQTLDQKQSFQRWLLRLTEKGIVKDVDFLYYSERFRKELDGFLDRKTVEQQ